MEKSKFVMSDIKHGGGLFKMLATDKSTEYKDKMRHVDICNSDKSADLCLTRYFLQFGI